MKIKMNKTHTESRLSEFVILDVDRMTSVQEKDVIRWRRRFTPLIIISLMKDKWIVKDIPNYILTCMSIYVFFPPSSPLRQLL